VMEDAAGICLQHRMFGIAQHVVCHRRRSNQVDPRQDIGDRIAQYLCPR
jgi:hypothetical protein